MIDNILATINQSALKLLASQTMEGLCKTIVEEGRKLVDAEYGSLFVLHKNKLERVYSSSPILHKAKIKRTGYVDKIFKRGKVTILQSPINEKTSPEYKALGIKSVVVLPLSYKTGSVGMLTLHSMKEEYFTSKQLHILKLYASMAYLALTKAKLHAETKQAVEVRDRFISLASHELRTPLTSINGYIQLLYTKMAKKNTIESQWMGELYNESIRLTNLVRDLLDINRIKQGQFAFSLSEVDMKHIIEKVVKQYQNMNPDKEIVLEDKDEDEQYRVIGDFEKLREMVSALLNNAVKFSKPNTKIIISLSGTSRTLHLKMKDYGRGIPQHDLDNIFEGFYKSKYSREKEGMGVGLLLAQYVVNYHRGKISISSKEQKGTIVDVELPRLKIE